MNNRKRLKKLILVNKETRWLYRMMQFLAIFMVVSCLAIITLAKWIEYDQNKKREELFGSWDEVFLNVDQEDLNYFRKNAFLEEISIQSIQEKVFLEGDQRVVIGACDENFLEMGNIELLEGKMPEHKKEVVVEEKYLDILGVSKIGDIVPDDTKVNSLRGYKVVGIIENYSNSWSIINNIRYINCFISESSINIFNIYVEYSGWAKNDPEINMINYKSNIQPVEINYGLLFSHILFIIPVILMLGFFMRKLIDKNTNVCLKGNYVFCWKPIKIVFVITLFILMVFNYTYNNNLSMVLTGIPIIIYTFINFKISIFYILELLLSVNVTRFCNIVILDDISKLLNPIQLKLQSVVSLSFPMKTFFQINTVFYDSELNVLQYKNNIALQTEWLLYKTNYIILILLLFIVIFILLHFFVDRNISSSGRDFNNLYFYNRRAFKTIIYPKISSIFFIMVLTNILSNCSLTIENEKKLNMIFHNKICALSIVVCFVINLLILTLLKKHYINKVGTM